MVEKLSQKKLRKKQESKQNHQVLILWYNFTLYLLQCIKQTIFALNVFELFSCQTSVSYFIRCGLIKFYFTFDRLELHSFLCSTNLFSSKTFPIYYAQSLFAQCQKKNLKFCICVTVNSVKSPRTIRTGAIPDHFPSLYSTLDLDVPLRLFMLLLGLLLLLLHRRCAVRTGDDRGRCRDAQSEIGGIRKRAAAAAIPLISPVRLPDIVSGCRGPLLCKQGEVFEVRRSVGHKPVIKYTANEVRLSRFGFSLECGRPGPTGGGSWLELALCCCLRRGEDRDGWWGGTIRF